MGQVLVLELMSPLIIEIQTDYCVLDSVRYFPKGHFPSGNFPMVFNQMATSQMCNSQAATSKQFPSRSAWSSSLF